MQTAATAGMLVSTGSGRIAFAQRAATLPGVSAPSSVVRSIIRTIRSSASSFEPRLIERLARSALRASSATASTAPIRVRRGSNGSTARAGDVASCMARIVDDGSKRSGSRQGRDGGCRMAPVF